MNKKIREETLRSTYEKLVLAKVSPGPTLSVAHASTCIHPVSDGNFQYILEAASKVTTVTHLLITSVPNGQQWDMDAQTKLLNAVVTKLGVCLDLSNDDRNVSIARSIQHPIHTSSDSSLVSVVIPVEGVCYASDRGGSITMGNEPYELMMTIEVIARHQFKDHRRFDGIYVHAANKTEIDVVTGGRRALFFRNLLRAPGTQIAQRTAITYWLRERLRGNGSEVGRFFIAFHNKYHRMPGDQFFTEHMAVLWCEHKDYTSFTNIIGERKSELVFLCGGFVFEMYNQEPNHLFPRHIPEYSYCITIRGIHSKYSLKDILHAVASCKKTVHSIWFEGPQILQGLGLLPPKDRLQDRIYLLVDDKDCIFELMKSPIQQMADKDSKIYMSNAAFPDSQSETLCFNRKTMMFAEHCKKQHKLPYVLKEQLLYIEQTHAKGIIAHPYEYSSRGSRRFLQPEKSRPRKVNHEPTVSTIKVVHEDDASARLNDMLTTIQGLVAKQADVEKQNASLQIQLNLQKKKQEDLEADLKKKKKDDSDLAAMRKNDIKHLMEKVVSSEKLIKALDSNSSDFKASENRLLKMYEESQIKFKNLEDTNNDLVRILLSKNILTHNSPDTTYNDV